MASYHCQRNKKAPAARAAPLHCRRRKHAKHGNDHQGPRSGTVGSPPGLRSCLRPVDWTAFTPEPRWQWLRRSSDQTGAGGTFGTIANLHLISRKLFIPVNNKTPAFQLKHRVSDPITPQPAEPDADSPDGD